MKRMKKIGIFFIFLILFLSVFYIITGFYVVPPGAINKGYTHWFVRAGTGYPFISSPASILKKTSNFTSMKSNLKKVLNFPKDNVIATFKYSKFLYSFTESNSKNK